jgi:hypothetical protein
MRSNERAIRRASSNYASPRGFGGVQAKPKLMEVNPLRNTGLVAIFDCPAVRYLLGGYSVAPLQINTQITTAINNCLTARN